LLPATLFAIVIAGVVAIVPSLLLTTLVAVPIARVVAVAVTLFVASIQSGQWESRNQTKNHLPLTGQDTQHQASLP
jgi:hypothetical protein